jgi:hypothetical protein
MQFCLGKCSKDLIKKNINGSEFIDLRVSIAKCEIIVF